jgi:hypothetical protein
MGLTIKVSPERVKVDAVCVTAFNAPTRFLLPVERALLQAASIPDHRNFHLQRNIILERGKELDCFFPIIIHDATRDGKSFETCRNLADIASAGAMLQHYFFGIRLPSYQVLFEGNTASLMRCWWSEKDGVVQFNRSSVPSPVSPDEPLIFDISRPPQMLELFLIVVNILKYLTEMYSKAAFEFPKSIFSEDWQKRRLTVANLERFNSDE